MAKAWVSMHCDGSARGNPGPAGWGAVLQWRSNIGEFCGSLEGMTGNQAELMAVIKGFEQLKRNGLLVTVYSDSQYVVFGAQGVWKIKTNHEIWKQLFAHVKEHNQVLFNWIPREQNGRADKLAKRGVQADKHFDS